MWLQQQRSLESNVWQIRLTRRNNKLCQRFQSEATFPQLSLRQPLFPPRSSCLPFFALCFSDCYHHLSALLPENEPVLCARQIVLSGGRAMLRGFPAVSLRILWTSKCHWSHQSGDHSSHKRLLSQKAGSNIFFPPIYRRFLSPSPKWRLSELKLAVMWIWNA